MPIASKNSELPKSYRELCLQVWLPQPILDEVGYKTAVDVVDALGFLADRTEGQDLYVEAVSMFIESYESEVVTKPRATVPEILQYLCEVNGMSAADLSRLLGDKNRATGSNLLNGAREPSKAHIKILCERFRLNPSVFFEESA